MSPTQKIQKSLPEAQGARAPLRPRLISAKELPLKGIHLHLNHLRRMWTADPPKFPKPVYVSARRFAWPEADIDAWINGRIANPTSRKATRKTAEV